MSVQIILASSSTYRKELLERLGIDFLIESPLVDENPLKQKIHDPQELAMTLSKLKARSVFEQYPEHFVIGSDQVAAIDNYILGKPSTPERAFDQLKMLQGKTHQLYTAVTIMGPDHIESFLEVANMFMRPLTDKQILSYIETDHPYDCAGSYKLERKGVALFHKIESEDHTSIIGLPLTKLTTSLLELGLKII